MNPPANWYPDPTGRHGQRYWDGSQWTEHVFTDGIQDVDPLDLATAADETTATDDTDEVIEAAAAGDVDEAGEAAAGENEPQVGTTEVTGLAADDTTAGATPTGAGGPRDSTAAATSWTGLDERGDADESSSTPTEASGAGLFADAATSQPDTGHTPDGAPWRPDDGPSAADEDVAPEVEPDDVIAAVDEMADAPGESDFSDAFVLAPETASRLVGSSEPVPDAAAATEEPAEEPADESADVVGPPPSVTDRVPDRVDDPAPATAPSVADAAPPAQAPRQLTPASLGMSGDLVSGAFAEQEDVGPVALQNSRLLRCSAAGGIVARQGTMVAYQGEVDFERQGAGGVGRALKRAATGEGLAMMRVTGSGDVFFADGGQHVFLLQLDGGPGLSVNGRNVLAFSSSLQWDIERVKGASLLAGGLFNTTLRGSGWVALVSDGEPVVLRTDDAPTFVDVNALVAWSGGLDTRIVSTVGAKSLVGLGSGEAFQMAFEGPGIVVVQPSEGAPASAG